MISRRASTEKMPKPFYITTTLPYVNADPHVGFAMEIIRADAVARYKRLGGFEVFFNTGTDEHGAKIYQKASEAGQDPQACVDFYAQRFRQLIPLLNISPDINFIRTTDEHHIKAAQEFWRLCDQNGFIYKKDYQIKYCVGCELDKTDSELADGRCPLHPNREIELINEQNYFFKFSAFGDKLLKFYETRSDFVVPDFRYNEIKAFVGRELEDFSISRLASKMPWGITVPDDNEQVMYVWFEALVNYVSAIGWPDDETKFQKWGVESGGMIQYCGKDNLRQQSAMWQAMLMAAGLPNSRQIIIDGFITGEGGVKMSKSLGNVVSPLDVVKDYDADSLRYYLLREVSPFEDSPFSMELFKNAYNANLANGLGNLTSRIMKMAESYLAEPVSLPKYEFPEDYKEAFTGYELSKAINVVWQKIGEADTLITEKKPFSVWKTDQESARVIVIDLVKRLGEISFLLQPLLPVTADKITSAIKANKLSEALFLRKE